VEGGEANLLIGSAPLFGKRKNPKERTFNLRRGRIEGCQGYRGGGLEKKGGGWGSFLFCGPRGESSSSIPKEKSSIHLLLNLGRDKSFPAKAIAHEEKFSNSPWEGKVSGERERIFFPPITGLFPRLER